MIKKREIGLAVLLTVIMVAVSPFFTGWIFQYCYQQDINSLNSSDLFHVEIQSYQRGWYHSKVMLTIEVPLESFNVFSISTDTLDTHKKVTLNLTEEVN